jgi:hypothetical protein
LGIAASVVSELPELSVDDSSSSLIMNGKAGKLTFTWCKHGLDGQGAGGQSKRERRWRWVWGVAKDKLFEADMVNNLYKGEKSVLLMNSLAIWFYDTHELWGWQCWDSYFRSQTGWWR